MKSRLKVVYVRISYSYILCSSHLAVVDNYFLLFRYICYSECVSIIMIQLSS